MEAITRAIFEIVHGSDANAIVIRTGEAAEALLTCWPASSRCRRQRHARRPQSASTIDDLGKRLRRQIAAAEASEDLQEFISRTFRGNDVEGTA